MTAERTVLHGGPHRAATRRPRPRAAYRKCWATTELRFACCPPRRSTGDRCTCLPTTCGPWASKSRWSTPTRSAAEGCELVLVLGGDGTFLRAAELARNAEHPGAGRQPGPDRLSGRGRGGGHRRVLEHVVARDYRVEDRLTLDVVVRQGGSRHRARAGRSTKPAWKRVRGWVCSGWSSKSTGGRYRRSAATGCWCRRRPDPPPTRSPRAARCCGRTSKQSWWCPTTLTRCSAGRWSPVPTPPSRSRSRRDGHDALVFCDGRREMLLPAGGRLEVTRCGTPVKWARLDSAPFTDRLVRKFRLPVTGWRGN